MKQPKPGNQPGNTHYSRHHNTPTLPATGKTLQRPEQWERTYPMTAALTVARGSRIGRAPAPDPYRFNPIRETNRARIKIITRGDCEWFAWRPRTDTIILRPDPNPWVLRGAITLALAHRALGHWGNTVAQDVEARNLASHWLISDEEATWARRALPTLGINEVAAHLQLPTQPVRIRLAQVCRCLTNLNVHRGDECDCAIAA